MKNKNRLEKKENKENKAGSLVIVAVLIFLISIVAVMAAAPTIDAVVISPDDSVAPGFQVAPGVGVDKVITIIAEITDLDGVGDIQSVKSVTPVGIITLNKVSDIDSDTASFSNTFAMHFYDAPVNYPVKVRAIDAAENKAEESTDFDYLESIAIELDSNTINFLNVNPGDSGVVAGDNDMGTLDSPTVQNYGNTIIDSLISGTNLSSGSDIITVNNVQYSFVGQDWSNSLAGILGYSPDTKNIDMYYGSSETNAVSYKLGIGAGTAPGDYSGTVTIGAVKGSGNRAPVLYYIEDVSVLEGELVDIVPQAVDLDNDALSFSFTSPLDSNGEWQTQPGDAGVYHVAVSVSDGSLEDSQDVTITVLPYVINNFTIPLYTGWNLISLPLQPDDSSIASVLSGLSGQVVVWYYDASTDSWTSYDTAAPFPWLNTLSTVSYGNAYWLKSTIDQNLLVQGDVVTNYKITLKPNWNFIGYNMSTSAMPSPINGLATPVVVWSYYTQTDEWKSYDTSAPFPWLNTLTDMNAGKGYWIKSSVEQNWTI